MCFRRCRRSNFYSRRAFDAVDEAIFTPDVLSTLSTRQFSLPMCFRRCRRSNFHSRHAFDAVDEVIFTPNVQSDHHFGLFLLFGCGFIDYSGFSGASPLPHLRPRVDVAGAERVRNTAISYERKMRLLHIQILHFDGVIIHSDTDIGRWNCIVSGRNKVYSKHFSHMPSRTGRG